MKIGLLFGSFNPIHIGHLIIANYMANHTSLDKVWLVVSPQNPLKKQPTKRPCSGLLSPERMNWIFEIIPILRASLRSRS